MNSLNAAVFIILGMIMEVLPHAMPSWFPRNGPDGSSTSALWMTAMGSVQALIGFSHLVSAHVLPAAGRLAAVLPLTPEGALPVGAQRASGRL